MAQGASREWRHPDVPPTVTAMTKPERTPTPATHTYRDKGETELGIQEGDPTPFDESDYGPGSAYLDAMSKD